MDAKPVKIYSSEDVPRLRYIAGIILGDILGLHWEIVTDKRKLGKHIVINYSTDNIPGSFKIHPDTLLFETGIRSREIAVREWKGLPLFFQTDYESDLPFDIFAASFFLISRYEEYLDNETDEIGRYKCSSSLASRNGFLGRPVIDLWVRELAKALLKKFQTLAFRRNEYRAILTFDADQPFAYLGKNLLSSIGELFRDITAGNGHTGDRYRIVVKGDKDPYEVFDYITENIRKYNADAKFFFPVGDPSRSDKNPSWKNEDYRKLIQRLSAKFEAGLHPSFKASGRFEMIDIEKQRLKKVIDKEISISRFHSLRFLTPQSFTDLQMAGISEDYSMGYPEEPGFRAGIARSFYFYNVAADQQSSLRVVPFQVMDSTLCSSKNYDTSAAKEAILRLINETKMVGGTFVSIWHNTSLLDNEDWKGWREVFEFMLQNQVQ
jgi:hypothetical protein